MTTPANCRVYYYANREAILAKKREQYGAMTDKCNRAKWHKPWRPQ